MESTEHFENEIYHKFKRCPYCHSFSIKKLASDKKHNGFSLKGEQYQCTHCSQTFRLNGEKHAAPVIPRARRLGDFIRKSMPYFLGLIILAGIFYLLVHFHGRGSHSPPGEEALPGPADVLPREEIDSLRNDPGRQETVLPREEVPPTSSSKDREADEPAAGEREISYRSIVLGSNRIFGVNWEAVDQGLKITRINMGPFKKAGLRVGDVIVRVNQRAISGESRLLRARDRIIAEEIDHVTMTVLRPEENRRFYYRIVK